MLVVSLLLGCSPRATPARVETEIKRELPPGSDVRRVEAFLKARQIEYSREGLERDSTVRAAMRNVKGGIVSNYDILMEFKFDGSGRLTHHTVRWSDNSP